ncbi:MAG: SpoIID/LytB domain-containing protein [Candidatus Omnitrophica bacterium]|nr:SpoIID/LytB domain-containing protein [Candidatus Omnitrophota bacterium]
MTTRRLRPVVFLLLFFLFPTHASTAESGKASPAIRVLVEENQRLMRLEIKGPYRVELLPTREVVQKGEGLDSTPVSPSPRGIRFGKEAWACGGIRIEPARDRTLVLDRTLFRGSLQILKNKNGSLDAVNRLDVEGYLYGVLQHEVAYWWPMEALMAQAVAARTYALYQSQVSRQAEFDVKSSTHSQVYGGSTLERVRTRRAVDRTRGLVLTAGGKIFPAYFHATCGGRTAGAKELWKIDLPPLAGGVRCGYCRISPHDSWESRAPLSDIEEKLNANGRGVGQILSIEKITQTPSGRVGSLRMTGTAGETVLAAKDFRIWVGGDKLRSTNFTVKIKEDMAEFRGKGWGHGVGLCQWGTLGQAMLGRKYPQILEFYYPGSEIKNHDES